MRLSQYERETIINFNEADKTASVYTHNASLRRRLDQLLKTRSDEIAIIRTGDDYSEYIVPKKWIKVSPPRRVNPEFAKAAGERLNNARKSAKLNEIDFEPNKQRDDNAVEE